MNQCLKGHFFDEKRFSECPYCSPVNTAIKNVPQQPINKTTPLQQKTMPESCGKTIGIMKKDIGIDPPVGFVICISGPHKGEDFRLVSGRNMVGRSSGMDVCLSSDDTVSREEHAIISYDIKSNAFLLIPGTGRGITYCNDNQGDSATQLAAYAIIEVGTCRLIFLPLCSEHFTWNEA